MVPLDPIIHLLFFYFSPMLYGFIVLMRHCMRSQDVATENEFEKRLLAEVIPPSDIGVTFDDIGALENVKDTLKELVMLPLQRPELFCKGQLTKVKSIYIILIILWKLIQLFLCMVLMLKLIGLF